MNAATRRDLLDRYSRIDSPVHRLPAGVKLALGVALLLAIAIVPVRLWPFFAGAGLGLVIVAILSRIPPRFLLRRLLMLEPFVLAAAALTLFQPHGYRVFLAVLLKSSLCLLTMILLSNTTPFAQILAVLRAVRVPSLLVTTLALMYRYIFVLVDETQRMRRSRRSRTFNPQRWHTWKSLGGVVGQLFIRASERAERIYAAMCARGWR